MNLQIQQQKPLQVEVINRLDAVDNKFSNSIISSSYILQQYLEIQLVFLRIRLDSGQYFFSRVDRGFFDKPDDIDASLMYTLFHDIAPMSITDSFEDKNHHDEGQIALPQFKFCATNPVPLDSLQETIVDNIEASIVICSNEKNHLKKGERTLIGHYADLISKILTNIFTSSTDPTSDEKDWITFCSWCNSNYDKTEDIKRMIGVFKPYFHITHGLCDDCFQEIEAKERG